MIPQKNSPEWGGPSLCVGGGEGATSSKARGKTLVGAKTGRTRMALQAGGILDAHVTFRVVGASQLPWKTKTNWEEGRRGAHVAGTP